MNAPDILPWTDSVSLHVGMRLSPSLRFQHTCTFKNTQTRVGTHLKQTRNTLTIARPLSHCGQFISFEHE